LELVLGSQGGKTVQNRDLGTGGRGFFRNPPSNQGKKQGPSRVACYKKT